MKVSVIVITRDEHARLRLCLAMLARQRTDWGTEAELIVVDDGSIPAVGGREIPADFAGLRLLRLAPPRGRAAARNAGAAAARGDRLLFLDGDVLLSPDAVRRHGCLTSSQMGRGEQRHISATRFFADPSTGTPWPGKEDIVRRLGDLSSRLITEEMIKNVPFDFWIERSAAAIYPGAGPRKLYDLEMNALRGRSVPRVQWMAAAGHNFSIDRLEFAAVAGFDADLTLNEHRELALRLCRRGADMIVVDGAISIHLTHREGWRDPMQSIDGWQQSFAARHPLETSLMLHFWRSLAADSGIDPEARLMTLDAVESRMRELT